MRYSLILLLLCGCREPARVPEEIAKSPVYVAPADRYDYTPRPSNPWAEYLPGGPKHSSNQPQTIYVPQPYPVYPAPCYHYGY